MIFVPLVAGGVLVGKPDGDRVNVGIAHAACNGAHKILGIVLAGTFLPGFQLCLDVTRVLACNAGKYVASTLVPGAVEPADLQALALSLGADVPFFLSPQTALVEGVGERITPIGGLPRLILVLANPGESLATAEVFRAWDALHPTLTPAEPGSTLRSLSDWLAMDQEDSLAWSQRLGEILENDLEEPARRLCPAVGRIKGRLLELGAQAAGMSGSGSTSFGIFSTQSEAISAIKGLTLRGEAWARLAGTWTGR